MAQSLNNCPLGFACPDQGARSRVTQFNGLSADLNAPPPTISQINGVSRNLRRQS